ncbi:MAG: class I SAM-dependent methyltransferase [Candidatus Omnitrophota bacterium]
MNLKNLFDNWAREKGEKYQHRQWLLSKWDNLEGVRWSDEKRRLLVQHIQHHLRAENNDTVLDLGCGGGWMMPEIEPVCAQVFGCDISWHMLRRSPCPQRVFVGDAARLPLADHSLDRVLCYFVLINFQDDAAVEQVLSEILRILRPGGLALLGQLPDRAQSAQYDQAKAAYLQYCRQEFPAGRDTRDEHYVPVRLYDRGYWYDLFKRHSVRAQFVEAFNPFYRPGEPRTIPWRFDILVQKPEA